MRVGSLFSGIGGLELGLQWAGVGHTVWQVERDPYCQQVLAKHWPEAQRFDDVRTVGAHNLPPVDVICGGFPCQDISYAGRGAGLAGARSGLWWEFARIVREMGPRFVVVENVAALLRRGMGDVLGTLSDFGYDAEWDCVSARSVGAPHRRDRIFIVAYANGHRCDDAWRAGGDTGVGPVIPDSGIRPQRELAAHGADLADTPGGGRAQSGSRRERGGVTAPRQGQANHAIAVRLSSQWESEPDVGRVADGVPARAHRLRALGNAVVPQVAEVVGRRLLALAAAKGKANA